MLEIGSLVDGKYKILNKIGQGGMSVVYMALNEKANKTWAVKEVRKDGVLDFESVRQGLVAETDILKKLSHPNLPSIVDVIDTEDSFIIIMDYITLTTHNFEFSAEGEFRFYPPKVNANLHFGIDAGYHAAYYGGFAYAKDNNYELAGVNVGRKYSLLYYNLLSYITLEFDFIGSVSMYSLICILFGIIFFFLWNFTSYWIFYLLHIRISYLYKIR
mgnify:CR=1 FL=1